MIDKNGGIYKHSMNLTEEDKNKSIYIDKNIHYIPKEKNTRFGNHTSSPHIKDYCKVANIKILYTGLVIENFMGFSTQVPSTQEVLLDQEIKHSFPHIKQNITTNINLFKLTQTEYSIYYCLNHYYKHGTEDRSDSYYVYITIKNRIKENGDYSHNRLEVKHKVDINKILNLCSYEVKRKWNSLFKIDLDLFQNLCDDDKISYYIYWSKDRGSIYEKFHDRFYGEYEPFTDEEIQLISNNLKKINI